MIRMRYNVKLTHYLGGGRSTVYSKEAICSHCCTITKYIKTCPLACSKCEEILPPFDAILKNYKAKIMWHVETMS